MNYGSSVVANDYKACMSTVDCMGHAWEEEEEEEVALERGRLFEAVQYHGIYPVPG